MNHDEEEEESELKIHKKPVNGGLGDGSITESDKHFHKKNWLKTLLIAIR